MCCPLVSLFRRRLSGTARQVDLEVQIASLKAAAAMVKTADDDSVADGNRAAAAMEIYDLQQRQGALRDPAVPTEESVRRRRRHCAGLLSVTLPSTSLVSSVIDYLSDSNNSTSAALMLCAVHGCGRADSCIRKAS